MRLYELLFIAVGLSMDAFAVAVCQGLSMRRASVKKALIVGVYFGVFQALMPLLGYMLAAQFSKEIMDFDHWIAFVLLGFIGVRMILGSLQKDKDCREGREASLKPSKMLPLAVATSIDALAVGVSFAFLQVHIVSAASLIGVTTLLLSAAGVKIGHVFGAKLKSKAELTGGIILVLIGLKILVEHTGFIRF